MIQNNDNQEVFSPKRDLSVFAPFCLLGMISSSEDLSDLDLSSDDLLFTKEDLSDQDLFEISFPSYFRSSIHQLNQFSNLNSLSNYPNDHSVDDDVATASDSDCLDDERSEAADDDDDLKDEAERCDDEARDLLYEKVLRAAGKANLFDRLEGQKTFKTSWSMTEGQRDRFSLEDPRRKRICSWFSIRSVNPIEKEKVGQPPCFLEYFARFWPHFSLGLFVDVVGASW